MNKNLIPIFLGLFLIMFVPLAFAAPNIGSDEWYEEQAKQQMIKDISISLNKDSFLIGQTAIISLESSTFMAGMEVEMIIYNEFNEITNDWIIFVNDENNISQKFQLVNSDFEKMGTYYIVANYGDATDKVKFNISSAVSKASPQISLNDSPQKFEGLNELDGEKDKMIKELQSENLKLKSDLTSINTKLDSMNAVVLEQMKVISELAKSFNSLKNTVYEFVGFDIFV